MIYVIFLLNLAITVLAEGVIALLLFRRPIFLYYIFLCNLLTNPAMNLILWIVVKVFGVAYYYAALILAELTVILVEAFVLKLFCRFSLRNALLISACLNVFSFAVGSLIFHWRIG